MAHPYHHAISSANKFGGSPDDYIDIHNWFDKTKKHFADFRHRALRHHAEGIFICQEKFGITITNSEDKEIPVRIIAEQHVREDCNGRIPTIKDWLSCISPEKWMMKVQKINKELIKN